MSVIVKLFELPQCDHGAAYRLHVGSRRRSGAADRPSKIQHSTVRYAAEANTMIRVDR